MSNIIEKLLYRLEEIENELGRSADQLNINEDEIREIADYHLNLKNNQFIITKDLQEYWEEVKKIGRLNPPGYYPKISMFRGVPLNQV